MDMVTIRDVAKHAGVSIATVSRVLNNRGPLSERMKEKIYQSIEELDYKPNELARSLFKKNTKILGLIVSTVAHPFFSELTMHIENYAYTKGYKIMLCNSMYDLEKETDYIELLQRHQVDGIILVSDLSKPEQFEKVNLPVLSIERQLSEQLPCIVSDNYKGGQLAATHLYEKGCKNVALISGKFDVNKIFDNRFYGFIDTCKNKGINYRVYEADTKILTEENDYTQLIQNIFSQYDSVDGIFATSDIIALQVLQIGLMYEKKPNKDYKLVGFDDIKLSQYFIPSLTTIRQDINQLAVKAVDGIIDLINGKQINRETVLPVELIKRNTT